MSDIAKFNITPAPQPANAPLRRIFVHGLTLDAYIGAYDHEQGRTQPIRIDLEADVVEPSNPVSDELEDVVCYNKLVQGIRAIIDEGHIRLVETLAERIADLALSHPMVTAVTVKIDKPNAIEEAVAAGVQIRREKLSRD